MKIFLILAMVGAFFMIETDNVFIRIAGWLVGITLGLIYYVKFGKLEEKANNSDAWKGEFAEAYKKKDFSTAEKLYLDQFKSFSAKVPDIHSQYKKMKQEETKVSIYLVLVILVFSIAVYLMLNRK